jgi:hypothetical protein
MSSIVISGDTSGQVTLAAPAVAGTSTITLQAATATMSVNTLATAVASTSGTSIDFTSLPSWIKRVTVMLNTVSLSAASSILVQLGTGSTTYTTSGYVGGGARFGASSVSSATFTTGFGLYNSTAAASVNGNIIITNLSGNIWTASGVCGENSGEFVCMTGGSVTLGAVLTAVRITSNGADTFDLGNINILYEG